MSPLLLAGYLIRVCDWSTPRSSGRNAETSTAKLRHDYGSHDSERIPPKEGRVRRQAQPGLARECGREGYTNLSVAGQGKADQRKHEMHVHDANHLAACLTSTASRGAETNVCVLVYSSRGTETDGGQSGQVVDRRARPSAPPPFVDAPRQFSTKQTNEVAGPRPAA